MKIKNISATTRLTTFNNKAKDVKTIIKMLTYLPVRLKKNIIYLTVACLVALYVLLIISPNPKYIITQIYYTLHPRESIMCYRLKKDSLKDISDVRPRKGKSIFFHETSCRSNQNGKIVISARQACAVESAAKLNPNYDVYLLFTSPGLLKFENTESDRILQALQSYKNVRILHLDYEKYTKGTPVEELYQSNRIEYSNFAQSHASDVLRYLTLWKYGGIYLDLDVIVIRSLENLPPNYAGSESERNVAAGVMSFSPNGIGHHHVKECLQDLKDNFSGKDWGYNGPGVITRLLRQTCGVEQAKDMLQKYCQGFTVYPPETFYPVPWWNWTMYFDERHSNNLKLLTKNSYAIHVWNKHSESTKVYVGSKVPYAQFAEEFCPKVYNECDIYF